MAEVVVMPKLGFNMNDGQLIKWHKAEGDRIEKGEGFFDINTDKTAITIEATSSGVVLKKLIDEGDTVPVTTPIAMIGYEGESFDGIDITESAVLSVSSDEESDEDVSSESNQPEREASPILPGNSELKITPRARKFASENGLSLDALRSIQGSGFEYGITEPDVRDYLEAHGMKASSIAMRLAEMKGIDLSNIEGTGVRGKIMKSDVEASLQADTKPAASVQEKLETLVSSTDEKKIKSQIPYSGVRKIIGDRLSESMFTAPHLYFTVSVDMQNLIALRKSLNSTQERKFSVTDLMVGAVGKALTNHSMINASLIGDQIVQYESCNVGVAVAADNGLIVPVIKNTQDLGLKEISMETERLIAKARDGKLTPDEYSGGTFTISNLGMFGVEDFTAIINPPESAILAVSGVKKQPVVENVNGVDELVIRPIMKMTLSVDHRLIDGLAATQFITEIKKYLENPLQILV